LLCDREEGTHERQKHIPEFRDEATNLVTEQGLPKETAAKRFSITSETFGNWLTRERSHKKHHATPGALSAAELEAQNKWLRKELAELKRAWSAIS
jgi:transposase-like protein